jgi:hypothetical protein
MNDTPLWNENVEGGIFLRLGKPRGREMEKIQDTCRRISVGCGII